MRPVSKIRETSESPFFFKNCVVMGNCMFAVFKIDLPFDERTSGSSDRSIYRSFKRSDVSAYNGEIFPFDLMPGGHGR